MGSSAQKTIEGQVRTARSQADRVRKPRRPKTQEWHDRELRQRRNWRARDLHHLLSTPDRGGLTSQDANQLQHNLSRKANGDKKPKLGGLEESAFEWFVGRLEEEMGPACKAELERLLREERAGGKAVGEEGEAGGEEGEGEEEKQAVFV